MEAVWNNKIIAKSDETIIIEGNHYFPPNSINKEYLEESSQTTVCPWKVTAAYYNIEVDGKSNRDSAWYYPNPSEAAKEIKDYIAFWKGVEIKD